jgi:hypothetical protein
MKNLTTRLERLEKQKGAPTMPDVLYFGGYVKFLKTGVELWDAEADAWIAENGTPIPMHEVRP